MPVLKDFRRTKIVSLPKYEGSEIEIYDGVLSKDMLDFKQGDETVTAKNLSLLVKLIKNWNFTDEKDEKMEINEDNLGLFDIESLTELINQINDFAGFVKKKD